MCLVQEKLRDFYFICKEVLIITFHCMFIICSFQDAGMWQDALRVCKEYIPHKLQVLQDEYEKEMMSKSTK